MANIESLFPTPVGFYKLGREFTKKELSFALNQEQRPNQGNTTSKDSYILDHPEMKKLKQFVDESIESFFKSVYRPAYDVKPYVTQSWFNYTEPGQFHHKHAHPNSFISCVFYIKTEGVDKIYFYRDGYERIEVQANDWNIWNSKSWWFEATQGSLIVFPSNLTHMVETVTAKETRVSLAINTFLKGYIGDQDSLTCLKT